MLQPLVLSSKQSSEFCLHNLGEFLCVCVCVHVCMGLNIYESDTSLKLLLNWSLGVEFLCVQDPLRKIFKKIMFFLRQFIKEEFPLFTWSINHQFHNFWQIRNNQVFLTSLSQKFMNHQLNLHISISSESDKKKKIPHNNI